MAYVFNLWNFYKTGERTCEFDVTPANLPRIKDGTEEFILSCLTALDVRAKAREWKIKSGVLLSLPIDLDARDKTWTYDQEEPRGDTNALVISVHRGDVIGVRGL